MDKVGDQLKSSSVIPEPWVILRLDCGPARVHKATPFFGMVIDRVTKAGSNLAGYASESYIWVSCLVKTVSIERF